MFTRNSLRLGVSLCLACFFLLFAATSARANSRTYPMPSAGLVIVPEPDLRLTDRNQADFSCGRVSSLDTTQLEHRFTIRNDGTEPVTITQLQLSCHCTVAIVETVAGHSATPTEETNPSLLPGLEMVLKLTVQLTRQPAGSLSQGVYIFALGHDNPIARVHLSAELSNGITATPASLDFGPMKSGEAQSRKITLTYDNRLTAGGDLPTLAFQSDPRAGPETAPSITISPGPETTPVDTSAKLPPGLSAKTYLVTVRPTHPGDLAARLSFAPITPAHYKGSITYDTAMDAFRELAVSLWAQVTDK